MRGASLLRALIVGNIALLTIEIISFATTKRFIKSILARFFFLRRQQPVLSEAPRNDVHNLGGLLGKDYVPPLPDPVIQVCLCMFTTFLLELPPTLAAFFFARF